MFLIDVHKIGYCFYFDHRRRTDPEFRRKLRRNARRQARAEKEEAEAQTKKQRKAIERAVEQAKEEGFPTDVQEKEAYFMDQVQRGEVLAGDRKQLPSVNMILT